MPSSTIFMPKLKTTQKLQAVIQLNKSFSDYTSSKRKTAYISVPCSDEENLSLDESDIHRLYDEIDHLSPSTMGHYDGMR